MGRIMVAVPHWECKVCGFTWKAGGAEPPKKCPACRALGWFDGQHIKHPNPRILKPLLVKPVGGSRVVEHATSGTVVLKPMKRSPKSVLKELRRFD